MRIRIPAVRLPVLVAFVLLPVSAARADSIGTSVHALGDLGAGVPTLRFSLEFDSPAGQLLAVGGDADMAPLEILVDDGFSLVNEAGAFNGTDLEDVPSVLAAPWDSWVTIGDDGPIGNDTMFSPGFLGGGDGSSVIHGSSLIQPDDGGWYDSDPGTPDGSGGSVLIAQLTFDGAWYWFRGTPGGRRAASVLCRARRSSSGFRPRRRGCSCRSSSGGRAAGRPDARYVAAA